MCDKTLSTPEYSLLLTVSNGVSFKAFATPFGMSAMLDGANMVSCLAALTWLAAELVAAPF